MHYLYIGIVFLINKKMDWLDLNSKLVDGDNKSKIWKPDIIWYINDKTNIFILKSKMI